MLIRFFCSALLLVALSQSGPAWALLKNSKTQHYLEKARAAWSIGKIKAWGQALAMAEATYIQEKSKMAPDEQNHYQLWLYLFRSKWHRYQGTAPSIKNIDQFEGVKELSSHVKRWERAVQHLQRGHALLQKYNFLYQQISDQAKMSNRLYIQASLSQARDLLGHIQLGQVYVALLRFARQSWKDQVKVRHRISQQSDTVKKLREEQSKVRLEQSRLARAVVLAQQHYAQAQLHLERQVRTSRQLLGVGVPMILLGAVGIGVGIPMAILGARFIPEPDGFGNAQAWNNRIVTAGYITIGAGSGLLAVGATLMTVGLLVRPAPQHRARAVIRSQQPYIRTIRPDLPLQSLRAPRIKQSDTNPVSSTCRKGCVMLLHVP